jgi:iron complex outermembrane receptor protein
MKTNNGFNKFLLAFLCVFIFILPRTGFGQEDSLKIARIFQLGTVSVEAMQTIPVVDQRANLANNRTDVTQALLALPGITQTHIGSRNEYAVNVRGFDARSVPLYIDGIPVYVAYDGTVDLGRFKTFDYSAIHVTKGLTPMAYGANTIGGSINLISWKPDQKLNAQAILGYASGNSWEYGINLGTRKDKYFLLASFYTLQADYFPISNDFKPRAQEDGGKRENSYFKDQKINLKAGWTPNNHTEITLNYINQRAKKGNPTYVGNDENQQSRWWQWPNWDKESVYLIGKFRTGNASELKVRVFYDRFYNTLQSFDDSTFTSQERRYAFNSTFDDDSYGTNAEWNLTSLKKHKLSLSGQFKHDTHRELNNEIATGTFSDYTYSIGADDQYYLNEQWTLVAGIGFNYRGSVKAETYGLNTGTISEFEPNQSSVWNAQLGAEFSPFSHSRFKAYVARKSRFATLKDRYSFRLGFGIPNPELDPESAVHFNLTYSFNLHEKIRVEASGYLILLNQTLQVVNLPDTNLIQIQNTGESQFRGLELSATYRLSSWLDVRANYQFIEQESITNPDLKFIDVPTHSLWVGLALEPIRNFQFKLNARYNSDRFSTSYGTIADAFSVFDLHGQYQWKDFTLMGGVQNILDANFAFNEGFPEPGRNAYVKILFDLNTTRHD